MEMKYKIGQMWGKYTITGIKTIIHGKYFPNTDITHRLALKGLRGSQATANVYTEGNIGTLKKGGFGYWEGLEVLDGR